MQNQQVNIALINPKSASNVAVILRAAGCFGAKAIYYTGERYSFAKGFVQDTKKFRHTIATISVEDIFEKMPSNATPVVIELVEGATPLPEFTHPENAFYIFGPEDGSIPQSIVDKCEHVVYIPTSSSLNLGMTANIVLYDRLAKSNYEHSDHLIRQSRDNNNNLKK